MSKVLEAPVFEPTWEEMEKGTLVEFVEKIERSKRFRECGVALVRPPKGWTARRR